MGGKLGRKIRTAKIGRAWSGKDRPKCEAAPLPHINDEERSRHRLDCGDRKQMVGERLLARFVAKDRARGIGTGGSAEESQLQQGRFGHSLSTSFGLRLVGAECRVGHYIDDRQPCRRPARHAIPHYACYKGKHGNPHHAKQDRRSEVVGSVFRPRTNLT